MAISIRGAREHNLKDVDVEIGGGLTVVTGISGSGKTSLAFDTLYHEARRRFMDVFALGSPEGRLAPALVREIEGLGPAVAVGQNLLNRNPASTVASASGLHPLLRLLYARFGRRHCAQCGTPYSLFSEDELVERLVELSTEGQDWLAVAPLVRAAMGSHRTLLAWLADEFGAGGLRVDGEPWRALPLDPARPHNIELEIGRLAASPATSLPAGEARRIVRTAAGLGAPALVLRRAGAADEVLSRVPACFACGAWYGDLDPRLFHTPCPHCDGAGCERCAGSGLHPAAAAVRWQGLRLPELLSRCVTEVATLFSPPAVAGVAEAGVAEAGVAVPRSAERLRVEIERRLEALEAVGLGYLSLDRRAPTLSRGEAQRVRLAVILTSRLEDMLHVLDEPTVGLHPADVARLLPVLRRLAGPVVYVEHDRLAAAAADQAIDLGPGAGAAGGQVLFSGSPAELWRTDTASGRFFSLRERVALPGERGSGGRPPDDRDAFLWLRGAHVHNLREVDVPLPLARLSVITGVSGSGKSTLVEDVLMASLLDGKPVGCRALEVAGRALEVTGKPARLRAVLVDQSPIGLNPRSNPATYTGLADVIREIFAAASGLSASHFSFNRPEGACATCGGMGALEVQMRYLPSSWVPCPACGGRRFSDEVLAAQVTLGGRRLSIADLYELSIAEVTPLLLEGTVLPRGKRAAARAILEALRDVGLGYLALGQPSPTLSGGEAERVKLAKYLGKPSLAGELFVLDEPSTGLHPQDVAGLLVVLDRLVRSGATVVVVEHCTDIIRAADWVVDLGPGAGPAGGRVLYAGPPAGLLTAAGSLTGEALREEEAGQLGGRAQRTGGFVPVAEGGFVPSAAISIRGARAHNLQDVSLDIPKGALTVVSGVSGSGKSSLVDDVLEAEARRRYLESLSMYERQATREGPEAEVEAVTGLGVAIAVTPERRLYERRATVGTATELSHQLAALLAWAGTRACLVCGASMERVVGGHDVTSEHAARQKGPLQAGAHQTGIQLGEQWQCPRCGATAPLAEPRHFDPTTYAAACLTCHGVGTLQTPAPEKLIIHPEKPLCGGAMYSPGFFPKGYLCKPGNGGYEEVQALAERYGFDPGSTPWNQMRPEAQQAFLFGDPEPLRVTHISRDGRTQTTERVFRGYYGWVGDWDVGSTYTTTALCPTCGGARLRPEYRAVTLGGYSMPELSELPLARLNEVLEAVATAWPGGEDGYSAVASGGGVRTEETRGAYAGAELTRGSLRTARARLRFLQAVGLGYLQLSRPAGTLSAGEAQRIKLAGLLGSGLRSLTVLLDEPSRGLHPREVQALLDALLALRDEGNTVVVVEHDPLIMRAADFLVDMGPGAGRAGGRIVAQGTPAVVARADSPSGRWLRGSGAAGSESTAGRPLERRAPRGWLTIRGARANNLRGEDVRLPLGTLTGVCGVSGSGKSTLIVDTLARVLAPQKHTTSMAREPLEPGAHDAIDGAPARTMVVDQARAGLSSPADFLGLSGAWQTLYAASADAQALGLKAEQFGHRCSACNGRGSLMLDMSFLPAVHVPCEVCRGSGCQPEAWEVRLRGLALPELMGRTIDEAWELWEDEETVARALAGAREVGLGYLVLRQPGYALSGGEAQRLKIAAELGRRAPAETLYILDEPTVGQHLADVARLVGVLKRLVDAGHSVLVIEHHPHLLAACDWLVELGPGGGPEGGRVIAAGTPETLANGGTPAGQTPIAPYLREVLWGAAPEEEAGASPGAPAEAKR